jgi:hypothetical protein
MKKQTWADIGVTILKKLGMLLLRLVAFIGWVISSAIETLIHELNLTLKKWLFGDKD